MTAVVAKQGQSDAEKATSVTSDDHKTDVLNMEMPEGGTRAWLVVVGSMIINGVSFGYVSSFGVYQAYYQRNQLSHKTASDIAWIGSIQLCFMFSGGVLAGALFDRYGARVLMIPASVAYVLSIMFTSLCTKYWQFILAQGVFGGFANGLIFSPSIAAIGHYFAKKRGAAMGLMAVGSSVGGVLIPIGLEQAFSSHVGFGWGVRIVGFIFAALLALACVLVKERLPPRKGRLFAPEAVRQPAYMFTVFGVAMLIWGVFVILFYISVYAITEIRMGTDLAFYLLSILNGASLLGRIFFGVLADKTGALTLLTFVALINAVMVFTWTQTTTQSALIGWTVIFGFTSGGIFSTFPAAMASTVPDPRSIGTYLGQAMAVLGVAGLTGAPIAGALVTKYGFFSESMFGAAAMLAGAVFIAAARWFQQPNLRLKA